MSPYASCWADQQKRPTTRSESWGARVNGCLPLEMSLSHSVSPLLPRKERHVRAKRWVERWNRFRQNFGTAPFIANAVDLGEAMSIPNG